MGLFDVRILQLLWKHDDGADFNGNELLKSYEALKEAGMEEIADAFSS